MLSPSSRSFPSLPEKKSAFLPFGLVNSELQNVQHLYLKYKLFPFVLFHHIIKLKLSPFAIEVSMNLQSCI